MDVLEGYYGRRTFVIYALLVSVPGTKSWPRKVFIAVSAISLFLSTIFQVLKIVVEGFKLEWIIELLPTTASALGSLLYLLYAATSTKDDYNAVLTVLVNDMKEETTGEEDSIKKRYANDAKLFVDAYSAILVLGMIAATLSGFFPCFLNLVMPANETRKPELLVQGEIFIDQEKYFYLVYFCQCCGAVTMGTLVGVSVNMCVIVLKHLCGMWAIIGHKLQNIADSSEYELLDPTNYTNLVASRLEICVERHQRSLQFAIFVAEFYDIPLTMIIIGTFCMLTTSLIQVTDPQMINTKMVALTIAQIVQFFIVSVMGQNVIDASEHLGVNAYSSRWDVCPPKLRKRLQLMILRSSKPCGIVARRMYTLSVENFMSVVQMSMSFYMVLRQAQ